MAPLLESLIDVLLPRACAGCGQMDTFLCGDCSLLFDSVPSLSVLDDAAGVPVCPIWSMGKYRDNWRSIILAAKHAPSHRLSNYLRAAGARLGAEIAEDIRSCPVWIVPVPSSRKRRWRKAEIVPSIARGVCSAVSCHGIQAQVVPAVQLKWRSGSQGQRTGRQRRIGRSHAMRLTVSVPPGTAVVVVDDVFTTGATMQEMARVLGDSMVAGLVLATA